MNSAHQLALTAIGEKLATRDDGNVALSAMARALDAALQSATRAESALLIAQQRICDLEAMHEEMHATMRNMPAASVAVPQQAIDLTPVLAAIQQLGHRLTAMEGHEMQRVSQKRQIVFEVMKDGAGVTRQIIAKEA